MKAQWYLDKNFPLDKKESVKSVNISYKYLEDELEFKHWPALEEINCNYNLISSLSIINCPNVKKIRVRNNRLKSLDFLKNLSPEFLVVLNVHQNQFSSPHDLNIFNSFINLESLIISSNQFGGSLTSLNNLINLKRLWIANTWIDKSLEFQILLATKLIESKIRKKIELNYYCNYKEQQIVKNNIDINDLNSIEEFLSNYQQEISNEICLKEKKLITNVKK